MRSALRSDKSFKEFLKSGKSLTKFLPILLIACALIAFGTLSDREGTERESEDAISEVCSRIEGVGECIVTVTYKEEGGVYGVSVLCEGAEDPRVEERLVDFFTSLYGIGANRITVLKINNKN